MKPAKLELLTKVIAWRVLSTSCGFVIAYLITGKLSQSAGISLTIGPLLALVQWGFEIFWDKLLRERLRYAFSGQQGRISRFLRWRRDTRAIGVDEHQQGTD